MRLALVALALAWSACAADDRDERTPAAGDTDAADDGTTGLLDGEPSDGGDDAMTPADAAITEDAADVAPDTGGLTACERPLVTSATGIHRGDRAADFAVPLVGGGTFRFADHYTPCTSLVVLTDRFTLSPLDPRNLWESVADLDELFELSPDDVDYVFVPTGPVAAAEARAELLARTLDDVLSGFSQRQLEHWRAHVHVVATSASELDAWWAPLLDRHLNPGFAIDPAQRIRGIGSFADVARFDPDLQAAGQWPWRNNLAYAAYEALYLRAERAADLAHEAAAADRVIEVFDGEVLSQLAEADVTLPSASELAAFDHAEVEITMRCPDPDLPELGNCGAWDYLASLSLVRDDDTRVELARFITTYHREAHWRADITPLLALAKDGRAVRLRWEWAPEWNVQPTATTLSLHLRERGEALHPVAAEVLFTGADFNAAFNDRAPVEVDIPASTKKVELRTLVTGHGAGAGQCAEFCDQLHELEVNGRVLRRFMLDPGDDDACLAMIADGMTPNQGGTWWFGRGGWCPGAPVLPWVEDITADVVPGERATIAYRGFVAGSGAPPDGPGSDPPDGAGNIVLSVMLVRYE